MFESQYDQGLNKIKQLILTLPIENKEAVRDRIAKAKEGR